MMGFLLAVLLSLTFAADGRDPAAAAALSPTTSESSPIRKAAASPFQPFHLSPALHGYGFGPPDIVAAPPPLSTPESRSGNLLGGGEDSVMHIAFLVSGHHPELMDKTFDVMDNILRFTETTAQFYLLVDEQAKNLAVLRAVVHNVEVVKVDTPAMMERMMVVKGAAEEKSKIPVAKLFTPDLLPNVDRLILLDADIVVVNDMMELWREFDRFKTTDIAGMAPAQDGYYVLHGHRGLKGVPNGMNGVSDDSYKGFNVSHPGFNGGVMLFNLKRMRENNFTGKLEEMVRNAMATNFTGAHPIPALRLGDQSLMSEWPFEHPELGIHMIPNAWNFQLCDGLWTAYKEGPAMLEQFRVLFNFPPKFDDPSATPSLLHGNCGSGKWFITAVQKDPSEYATLLKRWCGTHNYFVRELCHECEKLTAVVESHLVRAPGMRSINANQLRRQMHTRVYR
jgi:hypothetical protein